MNGINKMNEYRKFSNKNASKTGDAMIGNDTPI